ncbi:MAG: carbohydrate kinase family protein [Ferruginibacter sp.]
MQNVFVIGGTTFDHIVHLEQLPQPLPTTIHVAPFHEGTGSTGSGKALSLKKLGIPSKFYSVLGDDMYGQYIIKDLKASGIDFFYSIDPIGTERHINIMDKDGQRISMFITQSSATIDHPIDAIKAAIQWADVLVINIIDYCHAIAPMVKNSGKKVWADLHDYDGSSAYHQDFIDCSDYIHLSSDNLPDYKPVMERFIREGKKLVVCTHGKAGATALTEQGDWFQQAALAYPMVDANGAGDAFFSGFLVGWMQDLPIETCLQWGAICGGLSIGDKQLTAENLSLEVLKAEWAKWYH